MNLGEYKIKRDDLITNLNKLKEFSIEFEEINLCNTIEKDINFLLNEKFHLVVVGEFSRGKSTFVNAMLGSRILPSSKKPTTAIISKIVYSETPTYTLYYREKKFMPKRISEEEFFELTAPKEASLLDKIRAIAARNKQKALDAIKYAEVGYPLEFCKDNVEVVDTPGTNDLNVGRVEITFKYIEEADAVILVLAANQALTQSELQFLHENILSKKIKDIFFVINYKDAVGKDQEEAVLNHVIENLHEKEPELPKDLKIHMVSSLEALYYRRTQNGEILTEKQKLHLPESLDNTGFVEFESELGKFLSEEKGRAKLEKYIRYAKDYAGKLYEDIEVRQELASHSADEIEKKLKTLEPEFKKIKKGTANIVQLMRANLQSHETEIRSHYDILFNDIRIAACDAVDDFYGEISYEAVKHDVDIAITNKQKDLIRQISKLQKKILNEELKLANKKIQVYWNDLQVNYNGNKSLDLKIKQNISVDFSTYSGVSISEDAVKGAVIGAAIGALVAGPIGAFFGGLFLGGWIHSDEEKERKKREKAAASIATIKNKIKSDINKSIRSDSNVIEEILDKYRDYGDNLCCAVSSSIDNRINDMQNQLTAVLNEKNKKDADAKKIIENLNSKKYAVKKIYDELQEII